MAFIVETTIVVTLTVKDADTDLAIDLTGSTDHEIAFIDADGGLGSFLASIFGAPANGQIRGNLLAAINILPGEWVVWAQFDDAFALAVATTALPLVIDRKGKAA